MVQKNVFLCSAKRTPVGSFGGALASLSATELGARVVAAVIEESGVRGESVNEVIMGCVLTAGVGQAPARQVAIKAGLPRTVQAMTVNKVCSSGLKAVMLAAQAVQVGAAECVIAGGMESMSQAPYLIPALRGGARLGHTTAEDSIIRDGLWDVYNDFHMGSAAELCAREFKLSRSAQDTYAVESYRRANEAIANGWFQREVVAVKVKAAKGEMVVHEDEEPKKFQPEKISRLKPVFESEGTVTAANASSLSDGAAAMIVCSEAFVTAHKLKPLARLVAQGWAGQEPEWFTTAPVAAIRDALRRAEMDIGEVDLFEINEAFSAVALACIRALELDAARVNVSGGAVALGHPIGASGARILTTLLYGLERLGVQRGVAGICNGGGEATAVVVERV